MISKLTKGLTQFYQVSLIIVMVATMATIFYFWKLGFIDGSRSQELHQANYILEQYQKKLPLNEIQRVVFDENSKLAINKVKSLENDFEQVHKLVEVPEFENFKKETQQVKKAIANLISFPKTDKVFGVFNEKLQKFYNYVDENKWRTLTRSSQRILGQTKGEINKKNMDKLIRSIQHELSTMEKITENSLLDRADKLEIISRVNNLRVETNMLSKYVDERNFFYELLQTYASTVTRWIKIVNPDISLLKLQSEQIGRFYVMGLLGILVLTTLLFLGSFMVNRLVATKSQEKIEKIIKQYVQDNIMAEDDNEMNHFSDEFKTFTHQTAKYINKRMSFGAIFQDSLPIGSILLDQNLKVLWANKHFAHDWQISEDDLNREFLSWDYLAKLTNLGEDDPVLDALKNGIAGIYQVQIKVSEDSPVRPYEMYVSPVKYNHQNRIQLYFYPLSSLQQTITDQAMSIVGPVAKTLDLMLDGHYDEHYKEQLFRDYEIAGIVEIQNKFNKLELLFQKKEQLMMDEVEVLHAKLEKHISTINELIDLNSHFTENTKEQVDGLKSFKSSVITLSILGKTFEATSTKSIELIRKMLSGLSLSLQTNTNFSQVMSDVSKAIPDMNKTKMELKEHKLQVNENKSKLYHSISQLLHIKKKITDPMLLEKFDNNFVKLSSEYKLLDQSTDLLDKKITAIELMLSRAEMFLKDAGERANELQTSHTEEMVDEFTAQINSLIKEVSKSEGQIANCEDDIVDQLKTMFSTTKTNAQLINHAFQVSRPYNVTLETHLKTHLKTDRVQAASELNNNSHA